MIISIPELGIELQIKGKSGTILKGVKEINLEGMNPEETEESKELCGALDAVDSLILAHACAGINVKDPKYIEGVQVTLEAIANNL
jgi:hypothetical protein